MRELFRGWVLKALKLDDLEIIRLQIRVRKLEKQLMSTQATVADLQAEEIKLASNVASLANVISVEGAAIVSANTRVVADFAKLQNQLQQGQVDPAAIQAALDSMKAANSVITASVANIQSATDVANAIDPDLSAGSGGTPASPADTSAPVDQAAPEAAQ